MIGLRFLFFLCGDLVNSLLALGERVGFPPLLEPREIAMEGLFWTWIDFYLPNHNKDKSGLILDFPD